jgi:flagellar biosynthesis protein FliR
MIYPVARAISAALSFGLSAQIPGVAVLSLALLWSGVALLVSSSAEFSWVALFFEVAFGLWMGLVASVPVIAARLGAAFGDERMSASYSTLGALFAGVVLFGAGVDHLLLRSFVESFMAVPAGSAQLALHGPSAIIELLQLTLQFALRVGAVGIVALLLVDLANSLLARLFPGQVVAIPREPIKMLGLYVSLGAISYVILQAAQHALTLIQG